MPAPKQKGNPFGQLIQNSGQARATAKTAESTSSETKRGRRSREEYTQVGAYIPKALYKDVQRRLLDEDQNFSELIEELLTGYLVK